MTNLAKTNALEYFSTLIASAQSRAQFRKIADEKSKHEFVENFAFFVFSAGNRRHSHLFRILAAWWCASYGRYHV